MKIYMYIQFLIAIIYLLIFFLLIFQFIFMHRPITKILILAFAYNILIFFLTYNLYLFNKEKVIFDFLILIMFSFLINLLNGIFIINNIVKNARIK